MVYEEKVLQAMVLLSSRLEERVDISGMIISGELGNSESVDVVGRLRREG